MHYPPQAGSAFFLYVCVGIRTHGHQNAKRFLSEADKNADAAEGDIRGSNPRWSTKNKSTPKGVLLFLALLRNGLSASLNFI